MGKYHRAGAIDPRSCNAGPFRSLHVALLYPDDQIVLAHILLHITVDNESALCPERKYSAIYRPVSNSCNSS